MKASSKIFPDLPMFLEMECSSLNPFGRSEDLHHFPKNKTTCKLDNESCFPVPQRKDSLQGIYRISRNFWNNFIFKGTSRFENIIIKHNVSLINFHKAKNISNICLIEVIFFDILLYKNFAKYSVLSGTQETFLHSIQICHIHFFLYEITARGVKR